MIIYRAFDTSNGKSYVGQTVLPLWKRRAQHHKKSSCRKFFAALRVRSDAFVWSVLTSCSSHHDMNHAEEYWIEFFDSISNGYNLVPGGNGRGRMLGSKHLPKTIEKMSRSQKMRRANEKILRISLGLGKERKAKRNRETRVCLCGCEQLTSSFSGFLHGHWNKGKPFRGTRHNGPHSERSKALMSVAKIARDQSKGVRND